MMPIHLVFLTFLLSFALPVQAEKAPALPNTVEFVTETWISDNFRDHLWCEIYREYPGKTVPLWYQCRLYPGWPIGLITVTEPYGVTYIVWADEGYTME